MAIRIRCMLDVVLQVEWPRNAIVERNVIGHCLSGRVQIRTCNESPTLAESNADVLQTSESSNRGILFVLSRSRVRRSSSP